MTTFAIIGDSQAGGLALPLQRALIAKDWTPLASSHVNGADSTAILRGQLTLALAPRPDVLIVVAGGNDAAGGESTVWGQIVEAARGAGARVVWIGPPAAAQGFSTLDAGRRAITNAQRSFFATKRGVVWIDGRGMTSDLPRVDDAFHVHLRATGYETWAQRIASAITSSGGLVALGLASVAVWGAWKLADRWSRR